MSKITFRADDDLVERLEACDASKSEVMREALRAHLDDVAGEEVSGSDAGGADDAPSDDGVDAAIADRVDALIDERLDAALAERFGAPVAAPGRVGRTPGYVGSAAGTEGINVNVTLDVPNAGDGEATVTPDGANGRVTDETREAADAGSEKRKTRADAPSTPAETACGGCGSDVPVDHVYCPNCGEKRSHRAFCECGDEVRTDWAFCPGCGRRTPAADVLGDR